MNARSMGRSFGRCVNILLNSRKRMKITRSYKTELDLNNKQRTACLQHAGAARFAFNWALNKKQKAYKAGKKAPTARDLHRELNKLKQTEFSWMYTVSKCAPQEALRDVDNAYDNFFRKVKNSRNRASTKASSAFISLKARKRPLAHSA